VSFPEDQNLQLMILYSWEYTYSGVEKDNSDSSLKCY